MVRLWTPPNEGNVPLCVAPSVCETHVCQEGDFGLTAAVMADTHCKSFVRELDTSIRWFEITPEGFGCDRDKARGCFDAYGRVYARGPQSIPNRGLEQKQPPPAGSWTYRGWCPPKAAMQPATPPPPPPPPPSAPPSTPPSVGPSVPPSESGELCPNPVDIKIALHAVNDRALGAQNVWNSTPIVPSTGDGGSCEWKRDANGKLPPFCEAHHACARATRPDGSFVWPEIHAYQNTPFERGAAIEYSRGDPRTFLVHIATNTPEQYRNGEWQEAGWYDVCVTLPVLDWYSCTSGNINGKGRAVRDERGGSWLFGRDNTKVYKPGKEPR